MDLRRQFRPKLIEFPYLVIVENKLFVPEKHSRSSSYNTKDCTILQKKLS